MLIARWFRLHPEELERTRPSNQLLALPDLSTPTP
jgi:hypothetical protein